MTDNDYRYCEDCQYMYWNEHGVECCCLDKIVGVKYFGCVPQIVIDKKKEKEND